MTHPIRIQRKRTKGWKMPPNTVYVGRGSRWGNPYRAGDFLDKGPFSGQTIKDIAHAVSIYREWAIEAIHGNAITQTDGTKPTADDVRASLKRLRGKNLACWCPLHDKDGNPFPCHADVLLELANKGNHYD